MLQIHIQVSRGCVVSTEVSAFQKHKRNATTEEEEPKESSLKLPAQISQQQWFETASESTPAANLLKETIVAETFVHVPA